MASVEVIMPKMGESITEGTVVAWRKQPGDAVELDETLLEIGTDKVDTDVPAPAAGILAKILVAEGVTVDVGTPIAVLETGAVEKPVVDAPEPESASAGEVVQVIMPKMGESITEGTVIAWRKKPGDTVELDETLLEIGTDKVDTDVPAPAAGVLREILASEGDTVDVGTVIATIAPAGSRARPAPVPAVLQDDKTSEPERPADATPSPDIPGEMGRHLGDGRFLSPLVRSIAQTEGLSAGELEAISGSGREGRITKNDILGYLAVRKQRAPKQTRAAQPRVEIIEMDRVRQIVSHHMTHSRRTAAHVTSFAEADVTNLVRLREANKAAFFARDGIKLTYTPFLVYAAVEALREHPLLNASVEGTRILVKMDYHVGIAVAIEKTGLVVPVIRHAGRMSIAGLAHAAHDLAHRARHNELQPDDLQGGTFTVTNVGSLGSIMGTPIILQPQVAILATGAIAKRPMVIEDPVLGDVIAIRHMMVLSLSYDHRIIDGAMGISYMRKYVEVIEGLDPAFEV